ncbi:MAG: HAD-IA family hydrolase [Acidimicrobiales bacterium]|jgi:putative hydrolase of the HAD superfamily|nr:HAD-IA family hydrolase [Acidimicrobiales bacterium]MDP6297822.1 HAD-IA family hydrolase [Acidimicrobiales bacterium]HJM28967.1 HAD-IA family hydrolase [Acidimicrobiales bacterium]HJM97056.1 HAD-IA family hydrolase [Acidimicrobiales bacterium]
MFKAVLFDFGGVITTSPFEAFAAYEKEISLPDGIIREINSSNPNSNAWAKFERNQVQRGEFEKLFEAEAAALGYKIDADRVLKCLETTIRPKMVQLVKELSNEYVVAILTNNLKENIGERDQQETESTAHISSVADYVHSIIESSKLGVRKPEPLFYEIACETLGMDPEECVFLDDLGINLKPAKEMGMTTIKVINEQQAIDDLRIVLRANG